MKVKRLRTSFFAFIFVFLLADGIAAAERDRLSVGMPADAKSFDPQMTSDTVSSTYMVQLYEPLFDFSRDKKLVGCLAESWKKLDAVTYQITLRKGVKFHNGAELTAEDAVFTLHRMTTPKAAAVKAYGANIDPDGFKIIDRYTFQVKATSPMAAFLSYLNHSSGYIMNKKVVETEGDNYGRHPIGTGPFKFVEMLKGDHVSFERFDDYWGVKPRFKKLMMRTIPEPASRVIELETGNVDLVYDIPNSDFRRLENEGKVKVYHHPGLALTYMGFNTQTPPFDDPRVRRAISMAIDREAALKVVYRGLGVVPSGVLLPIHNYFPEPSAPEYDPDSAQKLLKEAGVPHLSFTLYTNESKQRRNYAEIIQSMLADIGVTVQINVLEWGSFLEQLKNGNLPVFMIGWGSSVNPDPDAYIKTAMHSRFAGSTNRACLKDREVDELLEKGAVTEDGPERAEIYARLCKRIDELNPWCCLAIADTLYGTNKDLKGADEFYHGTLNPLNGVFYQ